MGVKSQQGHVASSPPPLVHALSGAVGAVVAMALLYPLDQVRAILQVRYFMDRAVNEYVVLLAFGLTVV